MGYKSINTKPKLLLVDMKPSIRGQWPLEDPRKTPRQAKKNDTEGVRRLISVGSTINQKEKRKRKFFIRKGKSNYQKRKRRESYLKKGKTQSRKKENIDKNCNIPTKRYS